MSERKISGKLRLPEETVEAIRFLLRNHFGEDVKAWIFFFWADIEARGGDIDIYIKLPLPLKGTLSKKLDFLVDLDKIIGEQKVDLVIRPYNSEDFISVEAKNNGVKIL